MDPQEAALFSQWLAGTDIELFEFTSAQGTIRLRRTPAETAAAQSPPHAASIVPSPSVGVFRRAHPSQAVALAEIGQPVATGDPIAVLQIGLLLLHVTAPYAGTVLEFLAADGAAIGYGAPLVRLTKAGEP